MGSPARETPLRLFCLALLWAAAVGAWLPLPSLAAVEPPASDADPRDPKTEAQEIISGATFYHTIHRRGFRADPAPFEFLVDRPDVAATVARALGVSRFRISRQEPDHFTVDDQAGARGEFRVLASEPGRRIYLARGTYQRGIVPATSGRAVVIQEYGFEQGADGEEVGWMRVSGYVRVESALIRGLAFLIKPLLRQAFEEKLAAAYRIPPEVSEALVRAPEEVVAKVMAAGEVPMEELDRLMKPSPSASRPWGVAWRVGAITLKP